MRWALPEIELLEGLTWGTLGLGAVVVLAGSPAARQGLRKLAVATIAGGMRLAQGVSDFGNQVRTEMGKAVHPSTEPQSQPEMGPVVGAESAPAPEMG